MVVGVGVVLDVSVAVEVGVAVSVGVGVIVVCWNCGQSFVLTLKPAWAEAYCGISNNPMIARIVIEAVSFFKVIA